MKAFFKSVLLFPICLGVMIGILDRVLGDWRHAGLITWALTLGLSVGVWFPFLLIPYLRRFADRG